MAFTFLRTKDFRNVLVAGSHQDQDDASHLQGSCSMVEKDNADDHSEDFTGGNHEWNNMLFELFYHPVNEDLSNCSQARQLNHVVAQLGVAVDEIVGER